jgi:hypothetical protein
MMGTSPPTFNAHPQKKNLCTWSCRAKDDGIDDGEGKEGERIKGMGVSQEKEKGKQEKEKEEEEEKKKKEKEKGQERE